MKKLLFLVIVLNLCFHEEAQAQSQTPSQKQPEFSAHSKRDQFAKPPHSWLKEMEGDSPLQDERLRNLLPPHLRGMKNLPPHILAERQWLLESQNERTGMAPNDPLDRLYPPHKRSLAQPPSPLKSVEPYHSVQPFQSGVTQILSGSVQEAWVAHYDTPGSSYEYAEDAAVDAAGNTYVTGYSQSLGSAPDYLTVKYDASGAKKWVARYNGTGNGNDVARAIGFDAAGNVYVTGSSSNGQNLDYATVKYNSAGTQEWVAIYNGPRNGFDNAVALIVDDAGNVYVTGYSTDINDRASNYVTVKYNSAGIQEWVATYDGAENKNDYAVSLGLDVAGNVYVIGYSMWYIAGKPYFESATVKYNASGIQEWVTIYNAPGNNNGYAVALAVDAAGNVYVTGYSSNGKNSDYTTVKYSSVGTQEWVVTYNGPQDGNDYPSAIVVDDAGNVYVTGSSGMVKYNSVGSQEWATNRSGNALVVDGAGNVYVTGSGTAKYNSAGAQQWIANGSGNAIAVDGAGNVYMTGSIYDSRTDLDYATVKYNASGVEQWVARHDEPGSANDKATAIVWDGADNIYVTGTSGTVKYNSAGMQQWAAKEPGNALEVDHAGNVYITVVKPNGEFHYDYATAKYNSTGAQEWMTAFNGPIHVESRIALAIDNAGNAYVTKFTNNGYYGTYVTVKYNSAGTQVWAANGPGSAVAVDGAGNFYVTGSNGDDYVTAKYNAAGTQEWAATYNGPKNGRDQAAALVVDDAGNVYVTGLGGYFETFSYDDEISWSVDRYDYATVKYNSTGTQEWAKIYGNGDNADDDEDEEIFLPALAVDSVGNVYLTGSGATVKYNSAGTQQWIVNESGILAVDNVGSVYMTGSQRKGTTHYDYATVKYNASGIQEWMATYNGLGNGDDHAVALTVDAAGNVYVTGYSYNSNTGIDYVTIKYTQNPIADAGPDKEICAGSSVQIGGNPTGSGSNGGPYTFSWTPTTGLNDPTAPNPIASPASTTSYTVTVTETATDLSAKDTVTVTVPAAGWSVAHIVDVDDVIFGIDQNATDPQGGIPRNNRSLALSPDERFFYLGYYNPPVKRRLVRKIDLSVTDPANNHSAVVTQLRLPHGTLPVWDIATDDRGRVYLALGTKIEVYNSDLQTPTLCTISGFTDCEGLATRRENGNLVVYATDRLDKTLKRFVLTEGTGEAITSSRKAGLGGNGEVRIIGASSPGGLGIGKYGMAWIADNDKGKVYRVDTAGRTVDSTVVDKAMDVAIDTTRGEVYVSQYTLRTIKVLNVSGGKIKRTLTPPAADLKVNLKGEAQTGAAGWGALCGIAVASCQRVFVANEKGRSILINGDSPFSNIGDNNDVKAADTDPVLVVTGSGLAKESEVEESEVASAQLSVISYQLEQNYPNPFSRIPHIAGNPSTTIRFALPEATEVSLKIYDIAGQLVQTLVDGVIQAGRHQVVWDGKNRHGVKVASGIYFYQLLAGEFKQVRKMSLVR